MMNAQPVISQPLSQLAQGRCGLYIHIPFCESKCGYCDFYSVAVKDRDTAPLVAAVIKELRLRVSNCDILFDTIFMGGGTPTILPLDQLAQVLEAVNKATANHNIVEFTVEANPATVDDAKAALLFERGVNRVSMGAQSFVPAELASLERLHSPGDIAPSVHTLRQSGIRQINVDLIFGIPGQSLDTWEYSLKRAVELMPDHIACYGLTYEPGTRLTAQLDSHRLTPCDEGLETEMYHQMLGTLTTAGFAQYEISNFAKPGRECRHNLGYWRNEPYIGVGPSAAGCIHNRRHKNIADIAGYVRAINHNGYAEVESEMIDSYTLVHEILLMQLRLHEGICISTFRDRVSQDPLILFAPALNRLVGKKLVEISAQRIKLTDSGRLVANRVMVELAACVPSRGMSLPVIAA